ncbi:hypothetical protein GGP41_007815 [Bipolaris sorokiniana]|uniref:Prion-inhibition and propagation HeLo domain-containing protein n=1 Tax=Cochliobolus sativus TaxID=45130 RepID=A0A8H5ZMY3_COCSA|nr:hypothetical protein GGP41_007815 [Bipolaris sorokiniana]
MAEVSGLVWSVVSLYSTCRDCYIFFNNINNAGKGSFFHTRNLAIQESILKSWGFYWNILRHSLAHGERKAEANQKREKYLGKNRYKAKGILNALFAIADLLSDHEMLLNTYGIKIEKGFFESHDHNTRRVAPELIPETNRVKVEEVRGRMRRYKKNCVWSLEDREKFKAMIADLKSHNDTLYMLCPDEAVEAMNLNLPANEANRAEEIGPSQKGIRILADIAHIKAKTKELEQNPLTEQQEQKLINTPENDLAFYGCGQKLAVWKKRKQVVYVERKRYASEEKDTEDRFPPKKDILQLGKLLRNIQPAKQLLALEFIGLTQSDKESTIGYVYRLPGNLGKAKPKLPIEDIAIRAPITYLSPHWRILLLSQMFKLAKKLVASAALLHASGLLHKNIRLESVVFFPKDGKELARY